MSAFTWDRCFVTGLTDVDAQHQSLVALINRFSDLQMAGPNVGFEAITEVFEELASYAQYHFREEEGLMDRVGLDPRHVGEHRARHGGFVAEITQMRAVWGPGTPGAARQLLDFLVHWLAFHILGADQSMARQLAAIKAGRSAREAYESEDRPLAASTDPLVRALDGLFGLVSERNAELSELNRSLEAKVTARTAELARANQYLETLALTDALTGLPNRRHAMHRLRLAWDGAVERDTPLTLMMVDADEFKAVNDLHGHEVGDEVLRRLARALSGAVRTDDLVCRLGGDEFLVLCPHTGLEGGLQAAESVRSAIAALVVPTGAEAWNGSVSIGVASRTGSMAGHLALMEAADDALYVAKRGGRNRVACGGAARPASALRGSPTRE